MHLDMPNAALAYTVFVIYFLKLHTILIISLNNKNYSVKLTIEFIAMEAYYAAVHNEPAMIKMSCKV